jgi:hypothetical protein
LLYKKESGELCRCGPAPLVYKPRETMKMTGPRATWQSDWVNATPISGKKCLVAGVGFVGKRNVGALLARGGRGGDPAL